MAINIKVLDVEQKRMCAMFIDKFVDLFLTDERIAKV